MVEWAKRARTHGVDLTWNIAITRALKRWIGTSMRREATAALGKDPSGFEVLTHVGRFRNSITIKKAMEKARADPYRWAANLFFYNEEYPLGGHSLDCLVAATTGGKHPHRARKGTENMAGVVHTLKQGWGQ